MKLPDQITLPFFAYGIFKPGQLCFPRIKDVVEITIEGAVKGILKERDGIPLLVKASSGNVNGYLIYFLRGKEGEGYNRVIEIEPDEVYRWDVIKVNNGIDANVLLGRKEFRGSSDIEHCEEWDGKSDPYFKQGLEEVEAILRDNADFDWQYKSLFRLQMAYMLLWSAIERYASLKYHLSGKVVEKVYKIADEKCFADSLVKNVDVKRKGAEVYSTADLRKYTLNPSDTNGSIKYYYQVRSNAVHRGKAVSRDFDIIKSSLTELLAIFKDILEESFK